jgi:hypothetical protein
VRPRIRIRFPPAKSQANFQPRRLLDPSQPCENTPRHPDLGRPVLAAALRKIGRAAVPALAAAFKDPDQNVPQRAAAALVDFGPAAIPSPPPLKTPSKMSGSAQADALPQRHQLCSAKQGRNRAVDVAGRGH